MRITFRAPMVECWGKHCCKCRYVRFVHMPTHPKGGGYTCGVWRIPLVEDPYTYSDETRLLRCSDCVEYEGGNKGKRMCADISSRGNNRTWVNSDSGWIMGDSDV